ncbi:hypothetical protein MMC07_002249 [Pseudocyphellaria aurata]|nr:hypothetical protein [Pseudocyphellaria aurata]
MFRLFILIASFSAAIPIQDSTEVNSDKASDLVSRVIDFFDPISINLVALDLQASDFNTSPESSLKLDPGTEKLSSQNSDNEVSSLSTLGPLIQLGDQYSSPTFRPPPALALASNSEVDGNPSNLVSTAIDTNSGTDAQDSDLGCTSESTTGTKLEQEKICPNLDYYQFPPQAGHKPGKPPPPEAPHHGPLKPGIFGPPTLEEKDQYWLSNNQRALVSEQVRLSCARHPNNPDRPFVRPFPVCCAFAINFYQAAVWGEGVTDQANCVLLIPTRPYCVWYPRYCCAKLISDESMRWGYKGINCVSFS